ncbi:hypothetical protein [Acetoanaerobium sticklandii]|uniref:hypothetical protein n=1 Tax=Acetoanaerobium sticklandii TaxID=1511 RepID=UPI003A950B61
MRISRVNRSRVSDILVSRQTVVSSVNSVEKSSPSFEIQNSTFNFSDNFWLSKEQFYDHLEKMHSESEHYSEYSLKQDEYKSSKEMANSPKDEILSFVNTVLEKYNQLIDHIAKVDLAKNQNNISKILRVITSHNRPLSNLGIVSGRNYHLIINEDKFLQTASKSPHHLKLLLDPEKGILRKIHDSIKDVIS